MDVPKIMQIFAKETHGKSYNTYKYSFDKIGLPEVDYDEENKSPSMNVEKGETEKINKSRDITELASEIKYSEPLFKYFLDGSRHVFKVDDIAYNGQVFPIIAGQVGVGCCERIEKMMHISKFYSELVLAVPDQAYSGSWNEDAFFKSITDKLNNSEELKRFRLKFGAIIPYSTAISKKDGKLENRGVAKIQDYMIEQEKLLVAELVASRALTQDKYLIKDGSLEYKEMQSGRKELRTLQKIKYNYNWVVGVSKKFNPSLIKDKNNKSNGNFLAELKTGHRTPVARYENPDYHGDVQFAVWYLRLRDKRYTLTPFDGIVKIEKILMDEELKDGISSDMVDFISANIYNERNPTCYGDDKRWANHLYPVYVTEKYVKSRYMSVDTFLHLF